MSPALMPSTNRCTIALFSSDTSTPPRLPIRKMLSDEAPRVAYTLIPWAEQAGGARWSGGYLVWGWMQEHKPLLWALLGAAILAAYGVVAALQPITEFGRVYAAYGGIFIALSLAWGIIVDGFRPDRYDLLGALMCVAGVVVMVAPPRG